MVNIPLDAVSEQIITQNKFSLSKAKAILKSEIIAIIGYDAKAAAQALNLRDNGFNVIVGQKPDVSLWKKAIQDGWIPGKNLFNLNLACEKASFIAYFLSDKAQIQCWPVVKEYLTTGKTLCFSHATAIIHADKTKIVPPKNIDIILVAPKGTSRNIRTLFLINKKISSHYAVYQNSSKTAEEKALAFGIAIGSGYLVSTTFKHQARNNAAHEYGVLASALTGIIAAQYQVLRKHGYSAAEAFHETVEELTQNLAPAMTKNSMRWLDKNRSNSIRRMETNVIPHVKKAIVPIFEALYQTTKCTHRS